MRHRLPSGLQFRGLRHLPSGQAFEAFQRFGFSSCRLFTEPTAEMHALLQDNLAHGYPALLAVESEDQMSGHNLVVDGYRETDHKHHMNFGYGGAMDGWYSIAETEEQFVIYNMMGQEMARGAAKYAIPVSNLPKGVYIIRIGLQSGKFIVK